MVLDSPRRTDVLILGSGLAGLWCALEASRWPRSPSSPRRSHRVEHELRPGRDRRGPRPRGQSRAAPPGYPGGGGRLCHPDVVRGVVEEGPELLRRLLALGVAFTRDARETWTWAAKGALHAAHRARRRPHGKRGGERPARRGERQPQDHCPRPPLCRGSHPRLPHEARLVPGRRSVLGRVHPRPDAQRVTPSKPRRPCSPRGAPGKSTSTPRTRYRHRGRSGHGLPGRARVSNSSSSSSTPPAFSTAGAPLPHHGGAARRRRGASHPDGDRFMSRHHPDAELAPRDVWPRPSIRR